MAKLKRYELSPKQWLRLAPPMPSKLSDPGRSGTDNLDVVNGSLWVLMSGTQWHGLSERYGK